jgi:hypothetical protein
LIFNNRLFYKYISLGIDGFGGLDDTEKDNPEDKGVLNNNINIYSLFIS